MAVDTIPFMPSNTGGLMYEDPTATVDNLRVISSGGKKWRRQPDGVWRAAWTLGLVSSGNKTSQVQAMFSDAHIKEVVFDSGDVTINGTVTIPVNKVISFKNGARIVGTGTINGGIIDADMNVQIFASSITLSNLQGVKNSSGRFSGKWYGAKGDASQDDQPLIQKAVDTAVANQTVIKTVYLPSGNYITYAPIILYKWDGTRYQQVTVSLVGESEYCGFGSAGTRILFSNNNLFSVGVQQGKRVRFENLSIIGEFAPIFISDYDFLTRTFSTFTDGVRRDNVVSPHNAIAIDPFGNNSNSSGKPWAGNEYPGYASWYRGPGGAVTQSGSTGVLIKNCYLFNFVVGVSHSLNGETKNAEITKIIDTQFGGMKVCIAGSQDQEKCNQAINIMIWYNTHTIFATGLYGHQIPGNWYIEKVNIAGIVKQLIYNNGQGYYATYVREVFAERLGAIGYLGTVLQSHVSDCTFDFCTPNEAAGYYDWVVDGDNTTYTNCILRYYGPAMPIMVKGFSYFKNCYFDQPPYCYDPEHGFGSNGPIEQNGMSIFEDCTVDSIRFGRTEDIITSQTTFMWRWVVYGKRRYRDLTTYKQNNEIIEQVIDGGGKVNDVYWARIFNDANPYTIDYDANRTALVTVGATYFDHFEVGRIIINANNQPVGICTFKNPALYQIEIKYVSPHIVDGSQHTLGCVYPRYNYGSFIGNCTAGSSVITNVVFDSLGPSGSTCVGSLVEFPFHVNYAFTGGYQRLAKIKAYNVGAKTITLDQNVPMSLTGVQLGLGRRTKYVEGVIDIDLLPDNTLLPAGSFVNVRPFATGLEKVYQVVKTGFVDAAGIGGGETRQADWVQLSNNPVANKDQFILAANGSRVIPADRIVGAIYFKPTSDLTNLIVGTTNGGNDIVSGFPIESAGRPKAIEIREYFEAGGTLYFGNITSNTTITIVYE